VRARRSLPWPWLVALGVVVLVAIWRCSAPPTEEQAVRAELRAFAAAVSAPAGDDPSQRAARIRDAVARSVAPDAALEVEEASAVTIDPEKLSRALVGLVAPGEVAVAELTSAHVELAGAAAVVDAEVRLGGDVGRDLHARHRRLRLRLARTDEHWRAVAVTVYAETEAEPEARP
jgi:hypothetical protein